MLWWNSQITLPEHQELHAVNCTAQLKIFNAKIFCLHFQDNLEPYSSLNGQPRPYPDMLFWKLSNLTARTPGTPRNVHCTAGWCYKLQIFGGCYSPRHAFNQGMLQLATLWYVNWWIHVLFFCFVFDVTNRLLKTFFLNFQDPDMLWWNSPITPPEHQEHHAVHCTARWCYALPSFGGATRRHRRRHRQLHSTRGLRPGPRRRRRRTRWRQNSPARRGVHGGGAAASFYFCLRPVPEATVGCRPPTPTDVRCSAAPNTNFFLHSNFVKQCGEQLNDGKLEIRIS